MAPGGARLLGPVQQGSRAGREAEKRPAQEGRGADRHRLPATAAACWCKKFGRRGPFLACPGYPECKFTRPVDDAELPVPVEGTCELCGVAAGGAQRALRPLHLLLAPPGLQVHASRSRSASRAPSAARASIAERRTQARQVVLRLHPLPRVHVRRRGTGRVATPCPNCGAPFLVEKETKKGGYAALPHVQVDVRSRRRSVREALERFLTRARGVAPRLAAHARGLSPRRRRACSTRGAAGAANRSRPQRGRASCSSARCASSRRKAAPAPASARALAAWRSFSRFCPRRGVIAIAIPRGCSRSAAARAAAAHAARARRSAARSTGSTATTALRSAIARCSSSPTRRGCGCRSWWGSNHGDVDRGGAAAARARQGAPRAHRADRRGRRSPRSSATSRGARPGQRRAGDEPAVRRTRAAGGCRRAHRAAHRAAAARRRGGAGSA